MARTVPDVQQLAQALVAGDQLALARAITRIENESNDAHGLLSTLFPQTGHAHIIGVTGAPGTGKSTLVTGLARNFRTAGETVAIVAIDPTSPFTGGALLGDRVRMRALAGDKGVFMRSMATRGSLGGLSKTAGDVVLLMDAAGFDRIIVETVGVGQAEVAIAGMAHTTIVVEAPGLGDEVQAIKAGVMEIADLLVVNKADRPGADRTVHAIQMAIHSDSGRPKQLRHHGELLQVAPAPAEEQPGQGWQVEILKTVATTNEGVDTLCQAIDAHRAWLDESGEIDERERIRIAYTLENIVQAELNRTIRAQMEQSGIEQLVQKIQQRQTDPYTAASEIIQKLNR